MSTFRRFRTLLLAAACLALAACASTSPPTAGDPGPTTISTSADPAPAPALPADPIVPLRDAVQSHLANASAIAQAANDAPGVACWAAASRWVASFPLGTADSCADPALPAATGPAGAAEVARIKAKVVECRVNAGKAKLAAVQAAINAGPPDDLVTNCAVVVNDARVIAARVLALVGLGAAAATGIGDVQAGIQAGAILRAMQAGAALPKP